VASTSYNASDLNEVGWLSVNSGDLDGDGKAEIISAFKDHNGRLGLIANPANPVNTPYWYNGTDRFAGGDLGWIDVAAGDLDRKRDNDEIVIAFKDHYSDIHVVVVDGSAQIPGVAGVQLAEWWKDDLERGSVNHVSVATGDLDGDGLKDEIVVAYKDSGSDLQVQILQYNGTATLQELWRIDSRDNGRDNVASAGAGDYANRRPIDVTTGDLDGDMIDEAVVAFRIDGSTSGNVQLWALDVTNPANWTVDSSVWRNHSVPSAYQKAAPAVSVSAADLDGDGYDEIALGYTMAQTDRCSSGGGTYNCNSRWVQQLVTYEYTPFAAPEYASCPTGSSLHGCFRQRSGSWTSSKNYGRDESVEAILVVATGDLDRDTRDEIALAHYKWETDDLEILSFDAETSLVKRTAWATDMGSNRPAEFWLTMGDRAGDSRYAAYTDVCYRKTEAQVVSAIFAPPHWPEEHPAANAHHAGASFDAQTEQASGDSTEVSSGVGGSVTVGPSIHEIGASFTYGWEKEAFAEKSQTTSTSNALKYSTCSPLLCEEEAFFNAVQIVETTFNCFVYYEAAAGNIDVCLPTYTRKLPYPQEWWYKEGLETYPESWIPLGTNLAQGRSATQSSEDPGYPAPAARAVDGDITGTFNSGHVSHTGYPVAPGTAWWQVDLGGVQWLGAVQVWNRTDSGYTERLKDFYVFVSEEPFEHDATLASLLADPEVWQAFVSGNAGRPSVIPVDHHGRYVRVQLKNPNYLDMAELQVFGMPGAVDQWPKAVPSSTGAAGDQFTLTWPDPNAAGGQIVQTVPGKLLVVDADQTSVAASTTLQESTIGFGKENETITGSSTTQEMGLGVEIKWVEAEGSVTSAQKTSYKLSWSNEVGFYGEVSGLPKETNPPTMAAYQYDYGQYAWLQRATSPGGVNHAFLVGSYWVPQIGPFAAVGATPPLSDGPVATPAVPLISSATHPDPGQWVDNDTVTFSWQQPGGDSTAVAGYTWRLDQSADTLPSEINRGPAQTQTFAGLADGVWYLHVRALSTGGQWSATAHRAVRVDTTPPQVELAVEPGQPSGDNGWYNTAVTLVAGAADGDGGGVTTIESSTDGAAWQPYTAPLQFSADTAGTTVYARAADAAGHVSEPVTATFKIDRTAPDSHVSGGAGPGAWLAEVVTDAQGNEELLLVGSIAPDLSGHSGFSLQYDGLDWTGASETGAWHPLLGLPQIEVNWRYTAAHELGAGYHIFRGRAQDVAGNQEEAYEIARVLWPPKAAPDLTGSSVTASATAVRPGEQVTFTLVARNAGLQEAHVAIVDTLPAGLSPVLEALPADVIYDPGARTLTWPDHLLWPGQHAQVTFLAQADADLPAATLENKATFHAFWPNTDLLPAAEQQPFLDREQTVTATAGVAVDPALAAGSDRTRPWVLLATETQAAAAEAALGIPAAEDARWMFLREWTPDPDTGAWIVARDSGWLPYAWSFTWTLSEGQGIKYLGVWVGDGSGNISSLSEESLAFVNRYDGPQTLADGQRVQYRGFFEEGAEIMEALKTLSGDPDMYIWKPRSAFRPDRYSNATVLPGQVEDLGYEMLPQSGRYLLEVQAVGPSAYELTLIRSGQAETMAADRAQDEPEIKPLPEHPLVVSDPLSAGEVGPLVSLAYRLYLPLASSD
jgi:uncharacterized repeat protein (TIGR01451 family)